MRYPFFKSFIFAAALFVTGTAAADTLPCADTRTQICLLEQAASAIEAEKRTLAVSPPGKYSVEADKDETFIRSVITAGDKALARRTLALLPAEAEEARMQLLYAAGEHAEARKILDRLQEIGKNGTDRGGIWALMQAGDLAAAAALAAEALQWQHTSPYGKNTFVRSGSCDGDMSRGYPGPAGLLAKRLAEKKDVVAARKLTDALKQYMENKLNGAGYDSCSWSAARRAYGVAAYGLAAALAIGGDKEGARHVYRDMLENRVKTGASLLAIAEEMKKTGLAADIIAESGEIPGRDPQANDMFFSQKVRQETDETALLLGLKSDFAAAATRLEGLDLPNTRLNTFLRIAEQAAKDGDTAALADLLRRMTPFAGQRERAVDNAADAADIAQLQLDAGDKTAADKMLAQALDYYAPVRETKPYEGIAFGQAVMKIHARRGDIPAMLSYARDNRVDYSDSSGGALLQMLNWFSAEGRWNDFDATLDALQKASPSAAIFENARISPDWGLGFALLKKKEFGRYETIMRLVSPAYRLELLRGLVTAALDEKTAPPEDVFSKAWKEYLETCPGAGEGVWRKTLVSCLVEPVRALQNKSLNDFAPR